MSLLASFVESMFSLCAFATESKESFCSETESAELLQATNDAEINKTEKILFMLVKFCR